MNVFITITYKRPLTGAFCVSGFTKLPTSFLAIKDVMFHICAAVSSHPRIWCSKRFSNSLYLK